MKRLRIAERIRMAWEWLRCPSNRAIRRRLYFHWKKKNGSPMASINCLALAVMSRPRHERRLALKLALDDQCFAYQSPDEMDKLFLYLK